MQRDELFIKPSDVVNNPPIKEGKDIKYSRIQTAVLLRAMVDAYNPAKRAEANKKTVDYVTDPSGDRKLNYTSPTIEEANELAQQFRQNPKEALGCIRINLIELVRDTRIPEDKRLERLDRYLEAYFVILTKLDSIAFPPDGKDIIHEGVPVYIPDGLSDMGNDPETDPQLRVREKIRVNKEKSYAKAKNSLRDAIWAFRNSTVDPSSTEAKIFLAKHIMANVYLEMPYDNQKKAIMPRFGSVQIVDFVQANEPASVCRHIAMETQLRFQALGLESRLLKCKMDGQNHVANLLRINGEWYLVDPTNPEIDPENPDQGKVYARKIQFGNNTGEQWVLDRHVKRDGKLTKVPVVYTARNEMYYRVLDNKSP